MPTVDRLTLGFHYRLSALFLVILVVATCLGVARVGLCALVSFAIPLCVMEYRAFCRRNLRTFPTTGPQRWYLIVLVPSIATLLCLAIEIAIWVFVGLPGDLSTLLCTGGVAMWPAAFVLDSRRWRQIAVSGCSVSLLVVLLIVGLFPAATGMACATLFGINVDTRLWLDQSRGRLRLTCWPGLTFDRDGPNTELMKDVLGDAPEDWCQVSWFGGRWAHDNDVHARSVLTDPQLASALIRLPDDTTRSTVLLSLTDGGNFKRVHLAMLLMWVAEKGVDTSKSPEQWWGENQALFSADHDALSAAMCVFGWRVEAKRRLDPIANWDRRWPGLSRQLTAARYFELGNASTEFGEAYAALLRSQAATWGEERRLSSEAGGCAPRF
jgi:hypothetical protein